MNGTSYPEAVRAHKNQPDDDLIRAHLQAYRDAGVRFIRDGGDRFGVSARAKQLAERYQIEYRSPISALHKAGHYGHVVGIAFSDMHEFADLVKRMKQEGADFIKIMTTGIMDFQTVGGLSEKPLHSDEVREMVHIAHEEGMKVMSHTNGADAVIAAAEAGADSVEHGNFQNDESVHALAESGTIWVPTVSTIYNLIGCGRFDDHVLRGIWEDLLPNLHLARNIGVRLGLGSDAGAFMVGHGSGITQEWARFQEIFPEDRKISGDIKAVEDEICLQWRQLS